jgi:transposase
VTLTDKDARIAELEAEVVTLKAEIIAKDARIVLLEDRLGMLVTQVVLLQSRVEQLVEQAGKNSGNSHLPPSSDGPGQGPSGRKGKSGGKRGGKKGHPGHHRELLPPERVDEVRDLYPSHCEKCCHVLPEKPDAAPRRYQMIELPPIEPLVIEYRRHEVGCPHCGHTTCAVHDAAIPTSPFGPRLTATIGMVTGVYHLSRRKAQSLLADLLGIELSLGGLSAAEARVSEAVVPAVDEAMQKIHEGTVKHTDGTSWLQAGVLMSLWTIATKAATVFKIVANGRKDTLQPLFGALEGILVSDRATALTFWAMDRRQICWAHLLRQFVAFSERDGPAGAIGRDLLGYTGILFEYWHDYKDGKLTESQFRSWMVPLRTQVESVLTRAVAAKIPRLSGSCADMLEHKPALWTFIDHAGVEPTNNHAERELRAFVLWRKKSFGSQSERGNRFAERLMTVAHTARKQGKNVLDFLTACCEAKQAKAASPSLFGSGTILSPAG